MLGTESSVFRFADIEVREREFSLIKAGEVLPIEPKAFRVLLFLLHNPQKLISKEELHDAIWGDAAVTDGSLTRCIWLLRQLLGDDIHNPRYIETVATVGYRWMCKAEVSEEAAGVGETTEEPKELSVVEKKDGSKKRVLGWALAGSGAFTLCLAGAIIWYLHRPLPPLRVTGYTQITHDGYQKGLVGTDGSRLYFNQLGSIFQVAISGGVGEQIRVPVASPWLEEVSPDGANFLIISATGGMNQPQPRWNVRIPGGSARRLGEAVSASYSPDGSVSYSTPDGDIWLVRSDGTAAHKLASVGGGIANMSWSPDGRLVCFSRDFRLWEMSSTGANPHEMLPGWHPSSAPLCGYWTPDGKFFLFLSDSQIWALDERRGLFRRPPSQPIQLAGGPIRWGIPVPAKDGSRIFADGTIPRGELSRYDSTLKRFQPFLGGISGQFAVFSRDGKSVAYVSYPEGILSKANRDGSNPVQLTDPSMHAILPRWSPDGKQIAFQGFSQEWGVNVSCTLTTPCVFIVSSEGGGPPRPLLENSDLKGEHPNWSPDGRKIVFNGGSADQWKYRKYDVRILDLESRQVTPVPGSFHMLGPRWSPNGRYIVTGTEDALHLEIFDLKTQQWSEVPQNGFVDSPEWSRDGQFVYFRRARGDLGIFRIPIRGGAGAEKVVDLKDWHDAGLYGRYMGLDPTDAPLLLRDISSTDIYALTLEEK